MTSTMVKDSSNDTIDNGTSSSFIIVLGQSLLPDGSTPPTLQSRIDKTVEIYHSKAAAVMPYIIVSGADVANKGITEAAVMAKLLLNTGMIPADRILQDTKARNTIENALNSIEIVKYKMRQQQPQLTLVTSSFHMPRSKLIFDCIMEAKILFGNNAGITPISAKDCLPLELLQTTSRRIKDINELPTAERLKHEEYLLKNYVQGALVKYGIYTLTERRLEEALKQVEDLKAADMIDAMNR